MKAILLPPTSTLLLMSLAELAVEAGVDEGELELPMVRVAEKFAELYWPQTLPYVSGVTGSSAELLAQNQGKQAAVVNALSVLRSQGAATISQAMRLPCWTPTIRSIARTVAQMPVKYLQNVGSIQVVFLYDYPNPPGKIVLKYGVALMLRTFHPLIQQLARSGWVRHVRENSRNAVVIGQADGLENFMFGSSRNALAAAGVVLGKIQSGKCFCCRKTISSMGMSITSFPGQNIQEIWRIGLLGSPRMQSAEVRHAGRRTTPQPLAGTELQLRGRLSLVR